MVVDPQNDVFSFFFSAGSGLALATVLFGIVPYKIGKIIKNRFTRGGNVKNAEKTVYQK